MNNVNKVVAFTAKSGSGAALTAEQASTLCNKARNKAADHLKQLFQSMFDHLDDFLFDLHDKAGSNGDQNGYFNAMRQVRLKKESMQDVFIAKFVNGYNDTAKSTEKRSSLNVFGEGSLDGLLLVNDDELEESLAVSNMITKARHLHKEQLFALEQRYKEIISPTQEITADTMPVGPAIICNAFKGAMKVLDAELKVKLIVYKLFDRYLVHELGNSYFELNKMFFDAGILPTIRLRIPTTEPITHGSRNTHTAATLPQGLHAMPSAAASTLPQGDTQELFSSLQQMLLLQRSMPGNSDSITSSTSSYAGVGGAAAYDTSTILAALSALQHTTDEHQSEVKGKEEIAHYLKSSIVGHLSAQQPNGAKNLNQVDADTIDIVTLLFDFILDDKNLPDAFKALIARLQIPLLKVAIIDKTFFSKKNHPARRLLNELARAGIGWNSTDDCYSDPLYKKIFQVINTILDEFSSDVSLFVKLADDFTAYLDEEKSQRKAIADRLANSKEVVADEIGKRIADLGLPFSMRAFFTTAWKDVLTVIHTRDGNEGPAWQAALQLADDLAWSVQPKLGEKQKQRLVQMIPKILNGLQDGLTLIAYPHSEKERLFRELEAQHLTSLKGDKIVNIGTLATSNLPKTPIDQLIDDLTGVPTLMEEITLEEPASLEPAPALGSHDSHGYDEYDDLVANLKIGTWVEFVSEQFNVFRGKLIWKSEVLGEYTFVDRRYKVVADKSQQELAADFRNLRASVVTDMPLLDRALDAVMNSLKRCATNNSGNTETSPA